MRPAEFKDAATMTALNTVNRSAGSIRCLGTGTLKDRNCYPFVDGEEYLR